MTGYKSKRSAAQDKVTDIDGHVVRDVRKPKKVAALDRDAEIERLNEKIEFLARTNMLYSDWEHRNTQVTSDLMRKGIEASKLNAELRAEIAELKAQLVAQPAQELKSVTYKEVADTMNALRKGNSVQKSYAEEVGKLKLYTAPPQRTWVDLTDDEWFEWWRVSPIADETETEIDFADFLIIAQAVVAKLKEKNNGT